MRLHTTNWGFHFVLTFCILLATLQWGVMVAIVYFIVELVLAGLLWLGSD